MNFTAAQVKGYVKKVMASGFKGFIINITNPCDVITDIIYRESGLPKGHVFGTGTGLDTSRLVSQLSLQTGVAPQSISAYMIGEHGASQMAAWSCVSFGGVPLSTLEKVDERLIMPASMLLDGEYGEKDVFVGVPCLIGAHGVERVLELPLTAEEKAQFHACCEDVRRNTQMGLLVPAVE